MASTNEALRVAQEGPTAPAGVARGRYRIEERLGRGGAAAVFRALEVASGRRFAIKRLIGEISPRMVSLFELEYHTLSSLRHPNVVEVYDYGTDEEGPYYVMELLEGGDLSSCSRVDWREAATYACEVASALSVLHARRLLHRDVSARNVWRLPSGRVKLIDFGALAAFGSPGHVVGTPPHVAPEALFGRPLDQRTDLYALGALLYWLLSGSHAYPARSLRDLPGLWAKPIVGLAERIAHLPADGRTEIPAELDALVMSLLSENPMARPSTTGEVIDRLSALLGVESAARDASEIALAQPGLVGRERERRYLRRQLKLLHQGRGESTLFAARRGEGRSRLLLELATDARIFGVGVLHVQAKSCSGAHGVAEALVRHLLDALPELAHPAALRHASVLGHLSKQIKESLGAPLLVMPAVAGEARARIHEALSELFTSVARQTPLLILVDDLESADESSLAWLAVLAERLSSTPILLGLSLCESALPEDAYALRALRQNSRRVVLKPLSAEETQKLLTSLFGEVPHLVRLSERVHRRTHGLPGRVVEVARRLVREGLISNADGTWLLPQDLPDEQLALEHDESVRATIARLTPAARRLGALLSVQRGLVALEVCKALGGLPPKELFVALEELVAEGVLSAVPGGYLFEDALFVSALGADLSSADERRTHQVLAEFLLAQSPATPAEELDALVHALQGGDEHTAPARIMRVGIDLIKQDPDRAIEAVPALERALKLFRAQGRPDMELVGLLVPLATAGYFADRRLAQRYGEAALSASARVLGVDLMQRWSSVLGKRLSLGFGMLFGALRVRFKAKFVPAFRERIELFFNAMGALAGVSTICFDADVIERCVRMSEPFGVLGKNHIAGFIYEFNQTLLATVSDRLDEARQRWQRVIAQLEGGSVSNMPEQVGLRYLGGALYALGVLEAFRDGPGALALADRLSSFELKLYHMMADQVRTVYFANQGNRELYERYRNRAELHAIQRGSAWQVETWAPGAAITAALRSYDAMSLKESSEQLRRLEKRIPSLGVFARRARGAYLFLRRRYQEALPVLEISLGEASGSMVGWGRARGVLAACLNALGQHERAKQVASEALGIVPAADLAFPAMNLILQIELALAEAQLKNFGLAAQQLDALFPAHAANEGPLTLGALHEARARVALLALDEASCDHHAAEMERRYMATDIPSLVARCESFARERKRTFRPLQVRLEGDALGDVTSGFTAGPTTLERAFSQTDGSLDGHAQLGLAVLARTLGEVRGALFLLRDQRVTLQAGCGKGELPRELLGWVEARLAGVENDDVTQTDFVEGDSSEDPDVFLDGATRFRFFPLTALKDMGQCLVGAVVFSEPEGVRHFIGPAVLQVVAQRLARDMDPSTIRSAVVSIAPRTDDSGA